MVDNKKGRYTMNNVILMGRLVDDPDVRTYTQAQRKGFEDQSEGLRATFTLAVQREGKDAGADFIRCIAFGKRADFIGQYFGKGQRALVTGRWQTGSYQNKDGETVWTNDCYISQIEFADSKKPEEPEQKKGRYTKR